MISKHPPLRSFRAAAKGIARLFLRERNARVELAISVVALALCAWFKVSAAEWGLVLLCAAAVLSAEAMNTAVEVLADTLNPSYSEGIGLAKDLAAAAVLLTALVSAIVGSLIFGPRFFS